MYLATLITVCFIIFLTIDCNSVVSTFVLPHHNWNPFTMLATKAFQALLLIVFWGSIYTWHSLGFFLSALFSSSSNTRDRCISPGTPTVCGRLNETTNITLPSGFIHSNNKMICNVDFFTKFVLLTLVFWCQFSWINNFFLKCSIGYISISM